VTVPGVPGAPPEGAAQGDEAASDEPVPDEVVSPPGVQSASLGWPGGGTDTGWLRLSPRSLVVRPLTDLARLLPLVAGLLILHSRTGAGVFWSIAAAAAAVVTGLVHFLTTRYRITDERVYLRRGLLNTKMLSVARDRIRTVDVTAHLLHRVLGVCRVSIGTGRNDFRSGESFHLDGLTRSDAESLRALLLAGATQAMILERSSPGPRAAPGVAPGGAQGTGAVGRDREIVRLRLSWLRFAPLTMTGLVVLGVLYGTVIQISNATNVNLAKSGLVRLLVADFAALDIVERVLVGAAVAIVGYVLISLVGYIAVYWNFRLAGYDDDTVRVTRGLLSVRATTIAVSRLRGVEISEPMLLRAARGARCIAITTGLHVGRGAEHEGSVLLPPAPRGFATEVTATLLGIPAELCAGPLERHGPAALRRRYVRALAGAAVIVTVIGTAIWLRHGPAWVAYASLALLPAAALIALDRYRSLGHRLSAGWLVTRTGSFARRRSIIGTDAIIGWRIHQTWFQRRQGLMTLTATTAAGQQHYSLRDVPVAQGLAVASQATGDLIGPFRCGSPSGRHGLVR
jgi:putative membrane protein